MAFCKGAMSAIRRIWDSITPELEIVIEEITKYTGLIKNLEANPTVAAIVAIIPAGTVIEGWLNTALDEITGVTDAVKTLEQKLSEWLAGATTKAAKDEKAFKLASIASKVADVSQGNAAKQDSFYDSAVQLHVIVNKK